MVISNGMRFCGLGTFALAAVALTACPGSPTPIGGVGGGGGAAANASSSTGFGGSLSGTPTASSSGTPTASSSGTPAAASSSSAAAGSSSSGACSPTPTADANALACPGGQCTIMGNMGYDFGYSDTGPMTKYCLATNAACIAGTVTAANPPTYSFYGAGIGINLGPAMGTSSPTPVQLSGAGITVKLSNLPTEGARLILTSGGTDYCAPIATNPATIPWATFNTKCYDAPPDGVALTAAPATPHVEVQIVSGAAQGSFDFCIEQVSWQ